MPILRNKEILLGVTGGIAAYKCCELIRLLVKAGARVQVVMTEAAEKFVSPITFQTLTGNPVYSALFEKNANPLVHIELADRAELLVVAPATANIIGKMANGIADDLLSTLYLATKARVLVCPAMNVNMYEHDAVQDNLACLKQRNAKVLEPGVGELACGWEGKGRLPDADMIIEACEYMLAPQDFTDEKILITAGPTREAIDPIRFISNRSSGKMGYALARAARARGAQVTLVSGPSSLRSPMEVELVSVESARDMKAAVDKKFEAASVIIGAAAVGDFKPAVTSEGKIKKEKGQPHLVLDLQKNPDIIFELGKKKEAGQLLVGFAAETQDLIKNAKLKLEEKNLDMIVANDVSAKGAGFYVDTNIATLLPRKGRAEYLPKMTKLELAHKILDAISRLKKINGK